MSIVLNIKGQKTCLQFLRTTKAQTSLPSCAIWSAPLLFALWKVSYQNLLQAKFQYSSWSLKLNSLVGTWPGRTPWRRVFSRPNYHLYPVLPGWLFTNWVVTWDFQQCDMLTSVDSDEPTQSPFKLRNSLRLFKRPAKPLIRPCVRAGWSEALLVALATFLEISCHGLIRNMSVQIHSYAIWSCCNEKAHHYFWK